MSGPDDEADAKTSSHRVKIYFGTHSGVAQYRDMFDVWTGAYLCA
jgi:hypothetical protein